MYIAPRVMHFSVFILYISSGCLYKDSYSGVWAYNLGNCLLNLQKKEIYYRRISRKGETARVAEHTTEHVTNKHFSVNAGSTAMGTHDAFLQ